MRWVGYVACMEGGAYRGLVRKPEGKRRLGIPRHRWEDNIKRKLDGGIGWIDLAQERDTWRLLVNAVMNIQLP